MSDNEQIGPFSHADQVRKELTPKIDEKISRGDFFAILGIFVLIIMGVFSFAFLLINKNDENWQKLNVEVAILKSTLENYKI